MVIDLERCRRGMAQLNIAGTARSSVIEEAIAAIQANPGEALQKRYFGVKNYASFGDQREDHEYGMGPRHGSIVFRIERTARFLGAGKTLDADAIYFLEAYRDFGSVPWPEFINGRREQLMLSLGPALRKFDQLSSDRNRLADAFAAATIESHVAAS